jgi:hypothetical protein
MGKFDLQLDLLQGKDLHEKIREEGSLGPLHFAASQAFCISACQA